MNLRWKKNSSIDGGEKKQQIFVWQHYVLQNVGVSLTFFVSF